MNNDITVFDAGRGYGSIADLVTFVDCTLFNRDDRWNMVAGGFTRHSWELQLFSATLPTGAPLSATGWAIMPNQSSPHEPEVLVQKSRSYSWDGKGGRHCPSHVRGWDPARGEWVERIYYAGAANSYTGPFVIGFLEWDGTNWVDQSEPAFVPQEDWEHGSVYEPNLVYEGGMWKMWYVAGSNEEDYIVQGYAESPNGRTDWTNRRIMFAPEEKVFDFCVVEVENGFEAVFSRVDLSNSNRPDAGLWWCSADSPSARPDDWSTPVRIAAGGPWKPVLRYDKTEQGKMFVFSNGMYPSTNAFGMPFNFTINCVERERPVGGS